MFTWIRNAVKRSVLAGVADALEQLQQQGAADSDDAEERLRLLLPAPVESVEEKPRRKGVTA